MVCRRHSVAGSNRSPAGVQKVSSRTLLQCSKQLHPRERTHPDSVRICTAGQQSARSLYIAVLHGDEKFHVPSHVLACEPNRLQQSRHGGSCSGSCLPRASHARSTPPVETLPTWRARGALARGRQATAMQESATIGTVMQLPFRAASFACSTWICHSIIAGHVACVTSFVHYLRVAFRGWVTMLPRASCCLRRIGRYTVDVSTRLGQTNARGVAPMLCKGIATLHPGVHQASPGVKPGALNHAVSGGFTADTISKCTCSPTCCGCG